LLGERAAAAAVSSLSSPPQAVKARVVKTRKGNAARADVIYESLPNASLRVRCSASVREVERPARRDVSVAAFRELAVPHASLAGNPAAFGQKSLKTGGFASPPRGGFAFVSAARRLLGAVLATELPLQDSCQGRKYEQRRGFYGFSSPRSEHEPSPFDDIEIP